ncbi:hypothetical protein TWF696_005855 [Orbilia brochopaga]|uniref:Uncharacterized protein n=1 Tax=Orbilia brochopaga TaxID=3140254 RepID=A0AAV9V0W6_9PEZI
MKVVPSLSVIWMYNLNYVPDIREDTSVFTQAPKPSSKGNKSNRIDKLDTPGNYTDVVEDISFEDLRLATNATGRGDPLIIGPPDPDLIKKPGWEWLEFQLRELPPPEPLPTSD